ncbi:DNA-directed primase/polymerase protein [Spea bombifrons]|uniref:DNA-directed primase/polymerase protein n=1 Tax=Spea bombifrons TaxID=233779 RepID=UPI00234AA59E|nr:DNA-directed primase/polymerase protein [Spea bombifrons]XP_053315368.1 DNA-directed primase/polymerase protein [Spea bombifrons]
MMKRKWLEKVKKIEELASQYKRHPLSSPYKPKLSRPWQPSSVWKLFPRLALAFNFAKSCKEDVHVFALEAIIEDTERRLYLVTAYTEFWFYYAKLPKSLAHCYEVIPADTVCKLYFDLEFHKPSNPGAHGRTMVALVIEFFIKKLEEYYGIKCSAECVLNLDSSTEEKFSRHLIFVLPNAAFKDNIHVGHFIKSALQPVFSSAELKSTKAELLNGSNNAPPLLKDPVKFPSHKSPIRVDECNVIQETNGKEYDLSSLIVNDKRGGKQLFIDLGVYTKNRNFRLYKSSKLGKNAFFEVAEDNTFPMKPGRYISTEEYVFFTSLVSNIRYSNSLKILTCASAGTVRSSGAGPSGGSSSFSGVTLKGFQFSPYPEIDYFILSLVTRDGFQGSIRTWNYFFLEELLVYDIVNYRWCENIGRPHKSNNIMLLVDLKKEVWYQKCHDPVCRVQNFKSDYYPLPLEVCLPFLFEQEEEESFFTFDEDGNIMETKLKMPTNQIAQSGQIDGCRPEESETCWQDGVDDAALLEATEDAELADAVNVSSSDRDFTNTEIPDELLIEALNELDPSVKK